MKSGLKIDRHIGDVVVGNLTVNSETKKRYDEHLQWLRKKLGSDQDSYTQYRWGLVGVANGKGGEVHIFIHNRNNLWAGNVSRG
jgi:hypothetical protein